MVQTRQQRMLHTLNQAFSPQVLEVIDDSARHEGHAGSSPAGETHYMIRITSSFFKDKTRIEAHRAVNDALADEFTTGLHALSLKISAH